MLINLSNYCFQQRIFYIVFCSQNSNTDLLEKIDMTSETPTTTHETKNHIADDTKIVLTAAQQETVSVLLSMGFEFEQSVLAAEIFGNQIESAINYLTEIATSNGSNSNETNTQQKERAAARSGDSNENKEMAKVEPDMRQSEEKQQEKSDNIDLSVDDAYIYEFCHVQIPLWMHHYFGSVLNDPVATEMSQKRDSKQSERDAMDVYETRSKEKQTTDNEAKMKRTNNTTINAIDNFADVDSQVLNMFGCELTWLCVKNFPDDLVNCKDFHGNTPLAIAVRMGMPEVVHALLEKGADPRIDLDCGWNILQETCLYQQKQLITDMAIHIIQLRGNEYETQKQRLLESLRNIKDFKLEIKWQVTVECTFLLFQQIMSSVPLVTSFLKKFSDIENFKIWKSGTKIRFDSFVRGFSATGVQKGHLTFLFSEGDIVTIDHDRGTFENAIRKYKNPDFDELQNYIHFLMSTEQGRLVLSSASMTTNKTTFTPKKDWLGKPKHENVEGYDCDIMTVSGLCFSVVSQKENSFFIEKKQNIGPSEDKKKWTPPNFDDYFSEQHFKKRNSKHTKTAFSPTSIVRKDQPINITLWQSTKFPLCHKDIEVILDAISIASEDMKRLADIFQIEFQKGFPVKLG
ncbi:ankyrin repeat containing protein [Reticulomyxa filosa]|uniref:Ankyrin repeat containing protein n=1 Tax=Reticulomyxa filosa TaxID=46433 RepID=X6NQ14_RETFI|nr:ankyrin repeat containing protein [Reticulomyxa filosa]|eukprot:ETO28008.1 ankyrin repeat containing protein [Reticulomyxa filosa]